MITLGNVSQNLKLQNRLNMADFVVKQTSQRLSTGYKINSASDAPADFYIASGLTSAIRGTEVVNQNTMNAKNYLSIADDSIVTMLDCAYAIKDFAAQALNTTNEKERAALLQTANEFLAQMYGIESSAKFGEEQIFVGGEAQATHKTKAELDALYGEGNWVEVKSADELQAIATGDMTKTYVLTKDIDLSSISNFNAIGTDSSKFTGTFDGNGYTISNLTINKENTNYQGLFGYTDNATIKNVNLENANVKGGDNTGGLIGFAWETTITNSSTTGDIKGKNNTGGLIGNTTWFTNVYNSGSTANVTGNNNTGGLIGYAYDTIDIDNSYATGNVSGNDYVGGLTGYNLMAITINNSYSTGNVSGHDYVASFSGRSDGTTFADCYSTGQILTESVANAGGFMVNNGSCTITNCHYVKQEHGYTGDGTEQKEAWFENKENLKSVLGTSAWDYTWANPMLKSEADNTIEKNITFQVGYNTEDTSKIDVNIGLNISGLVLDFSSDKKIKEAISNLETIEEKLKEKSTYIGAKENILDNVISYQELSYENMTTARSQLIDANTADEMMKYTKASIAAQTTTSLMQQCSSLNANLVLRLIAG